MDKKLLDILACPVTRQPLALLDGTRLAALNAAIAAGGLAFGEHIQSQPLRQALITQDGKRLYRVDEGIPVLLPEESADTSTIAGLGA
ncbi:MAG: Trm112 family protein [Pseudomonadota bacterium]|nr:Trm112 family protein [Pseudomonadota bacterium]